jgi:glycerophosphoryl diester phosphodiesterase
VYAFCVWRRRSDGVQPPGTPLVLGHRGASAHATENTLAAFARARTDGADGIELDVLLCGSGEVVVFHDDDLARLAGRPERIASLSRQELRGVLLPGGERIPLLSEALDVTGPELLVNVELKAAGLGPGAIAILVERVAAAVADAGAGSRVLVSSFNPLAVRAWMRKVPSVAAGLLFEREAPLPLRRGWAARWLRPAALHPELVLCTPARVAAWQRRGYMVNVWTVDGPEAVGACRAMGVDAVITNDPARTRALLR